MNRLARHWISLSICACTAAAPGAFAEVRSPQPGDVYREYTRTISEATLKDWRVTHPSAPYVGDPSNSPATYLPNAQLPFSIPAGHLVGAIRAEVVVDYWGGHVGTTGAQIRFNGNPYLPLPTLGTTNASPECFNQQWNPVVSVPLAHLKEGTNILEGTSGGQTCFSFGWGQWGWYGVVLRVYYDPNLISYPSASVTAPLAGATLDENPTVSVATSGVAVDRVEVLARYDGADLDGDGVFLEYHQAYHRAQGAGMVTGGHVGTDTAAPFSIVWDTTLVPDQTNIRLLARVRGTNGVWYVTPEVSGMTLHRPNSSVVMFKPSGVPQSFWTRSGGRNRSSLVPIPLGFNLAGATWAKLVVATWNGIDGAAEPGETHFTRVNAYTYPANYGRNHYYGSDVLEIPPSALIQGNNVVLFDSASSHHGIEILWPGPHLLVRLNTPSTAACGDGRVDAGEQCDDGNTTAQDGCEADCSFGGSGPPRTRTFPAMYPFEEAGGTLIEDVANDNDGNLADPEQRDPGGRYGKAVRFDGLSGFVNLGNLDVAGQALTIALWFKADDFGIADARLISKAAGSAEADHYWMLSTFEQTGKRLRLRLKTETQGTSTLVANSATLAPGVWTHVAAVYDGQTMKLYQNGQFAGSAAKSGPLAGSVEVLAWIGDQPGGGRTFDGVIDEVLIDNRAYTQGEIQQLMAAPLAGGNCGDGNLDPGEACDDGNESSGDGCQPNCQFPGCGDGVEDPGEECDDGNLADGDGCQGDCSLPICGDGIVDADEECDDGNATHGDACSNDCISNLPDNILRNADFAAGPAEWNFYSNGSAAFAVTGGEARVAVTGAGTNVQLNQTGVAVRGNTRYHLRFDARSAGGDDVNILWFKNVSPYTNFGLSRTFDLTPENRTYEFEFTSPAGDATDGRFMIWLADSDRVGSAYYFDNLVLEAVELCGNGILDAGEQCDDGNRSSGDGCERQCTLPVAPALCGDGVVAGAEQCDDGNTTSGDGCSASCRLELPPDSGQFRRPPPGSVYKEFSRVMGGSKDWRVTDPLAPYSGDPTNSPSTFLPNSVLPLTIDDLQGALRAEVILDAWGGHPGTTFKRLRFNGRPYIGVPELATTPSSGQCYVQQWNVTVDVPLSDLVQGVNTLEGTSGGQTCYNFGWGQWGWFGVTVRVYYSPGAKLHPTGQITTPLGSAVLIDNPTIAVQASAGVNRVDVLAYYDGPDFDGDGVYSEYHEMYRRSANGTTFEFSRHVGTDTSAPFSTVWDTSLVPDQPNGAVKLVARMRDQNGVWYVTPEVSGLSLKRSGRKVRLYKPQNVPERFWISYPAGQTKTSNFSIPATDVLADALSARLVVPTWNGIDGAAEPGQVHWTKVNGTTLPNYGLNHVYSLDVLSVPVAALRSGLNTVEFHSTSTHHGIEVLWPGPQLLVTYTAPLAVCGNSIIEADEECDDGNTAPDDGCDALCLRERCGDGVQDPNEQCDDGNAVDGDDCTAACRAAACGDGILHQALEECDDGNTAPGDGCDGRCNIEDCGNGRLEGNEACDDGNTTSGDGCQANCRLPGCGDGVLDGTEACDDGNAAPGDGCDAQCRIEACGNGRVDAGEPCDDGNAEDTDACTAGCRAAACGDGHLRAGVEECDDGDLAAGDGCDGVCRVEACGNGRLDAGEQCDDGNADEADACSNACTATARNLIRNGEFVAGATDWAFYTNGSASFDAASGVARVAIVAPGTNVQLLQSGIAVEGATQYRLRIKARNTGGDDLTVLLQKHTSPFTQYGLSQVLNLSATDQTFSVDFTTPPGDKTDGRFMIWLADHDRAGQTYFIDDVALTKLAPCGNGRLDAGEQCDDGNTVATDGCTGACRVAACGDGIVRSDVEECDDGNASAGDGCDAACRREVCGNGQLDPGEACDDGNTVATDACTGACRVAACGDGIVRSDVEECDDGNASAGDGCDAACRREVCGNGQLDPGEECDDGNAVATDACTGACRTAVCGDGIVRAGVEECDDGNAVATDACTGACRAAACGDGIVRTGIEQCDDGNAVATDACTGACRTAVCGDGVVRAGVEECDDGNATSGDGCENNCAVTPPVSNLLRNGDFAAGAQYWTWYTNGSATFDAATGAARVSITDPGTNVQLLQAPLTLRGARLYRLRFKVRNNLGDNLVVLLIQHGAPYANYGLSQLVDVTTADQVVTLQFATTAGDKTDARLMLWLADHDRAGSEYVFDDFELTEIGAPRGARDAQPWVEAEPN